MSQFFISGGQSIGASASVSALPMNIQDLFPLGLVGLIFLKSKGLSRIFSNIAVLFCFVLFCFLTLQFKSIHSSVLSFLYGPILTFIHDYWKTIALTRSTFVGKVMSAFNKLSRLVHLFFPRSKLFFFFNFMAAVTICSDFWGQENKVFHCFHCFPIYLPWMMGPDDMILFFWMLF